MSNIVLITGATGSGKSTISHRVAENFPRSIHIQVDNLRDMMVKGMVPPKIEWSEEEEQQVLQQFQWARSTATYMAKLYASQGVDVVIDDVIPRLLQHLDNRIAKELCAWGWNSVQWEMSHSKIGGGTCFHWLSFPNWCNTMRLFSQLFSL